MHDDRRYLRTPLSTHFACLGISLLIHSDTKGYEQSNLFLSVSSFNDFVVANSVINFCEDDRLCPISYPHKTCNSCGRSPWPLKRCQMTKWSASTEFESTKWKSKCHNVDQQCYLSSQNELSNKRYLFVLLILRRGFFANHTICFLNELCRCESLN